MSKELFNPIFAKLTLVENGAEKTFENSGQPIDEIKQQRRNKIAESLKERFEKQSFQERLTKSEQTTINVLREGLLGFLPDETLLIDLHPQGNGNSATNKISTDPLWQHMLEFLSSQQKTDIIAIFETIEKFAPRLEDETQKEARKRHLQHDHLITLSDVRQVPLEGWLSLVNLGKNRANLIFEAVKKIE